MYDNFLALRSSSMQLILTICMAWFVAAEPSRDRWSRTPTRIFLLHRHRFPPSLRLLFSSYFAAYLFMIGAWEAQVPLAAPLLSLLY